MLLFLETQKKGKRPPTRPSIKVTPDMLDRLHGYFDTLLTDLPLMWDDLKNASKTQLSTPLETRENKRVTGLMKMSFRSLLSSKTKIVIKKIYNVQSDRLRMIGSPIKLIRQRCSTTKKT